MYWTIRRIVLLISLCNQSYPKTTTDLSSHFIYVNFAADYTIHILHVYCTCTLQCMHMYNVYVHVHGLLVHIIHVHVFYLSVYLCT